MLFEVQPEVMFGWKGTGLKSNQDAFNGDSVKMLIRRLPIWRSIFFAAFILALSAQTSSASVACEGILSQAQLSVKTRVVPIDGRSATPEEVRWVENEINAINDQILKGLRIPRRLRLKTGIPSFIGGQYHAKRKTISLTWYFNTVERANALIHEYGHAVVILNLRTAFYKKMAQAGLKSLHDHLAASLLVRSEAQEAIPSETPPTYQLVNEQGFWKSVKADESFILAEKQRRESLVEAFNKADQDYRRLLNQWQEDVKSQGIDYLKLTSQYGSRITIAYEELLADLLAILHTGKSLPQYEAFRRFDSGISSAGWTKLDTYALLGPTRSYIGQAYLNRPDLAPSSIFRATLEAVSEELLANAAPETKRILDKWDMVDPEKVNKLLIERIRSKLPLD